MLPRRHRPFARWPTAVAKMIAFASSFAMLLLATPSHADDKELTPKRGGTLQFAVEGEPASYDCHAITSGSNVRASERAALALPRSAAKRNHRRAPA